jgi:predicted RNA-binding Zn ribbon-like protein
MFLSVPGCVTSWEKQTPSGGLLLPHIRLPCVISCKRTGWCDIFQGEEDVERWEGQSKEYNTRDLTLCTKSNYSVVQVSLKTK